MYLTKQSLEARKFTATSYARGQTQYVRIAGDSIAATDGYCLVKLDLEPWTKVKNDLPDSVQPIDFDPFLVMPDELDDVYKMIGSGKDEGFAVVTKQKRPTMAPDSSYRRYEPGEITLTVVRPGGKVRHVVVKTHPTEGYPDFERVIPKHEEAQAKAALNASGLKPLVELAGKLSTDYNKAVRLYVKDHEHPVRLDVDGKATIVLMPVTW